ncbi:alginate export family protein [Pseudomonas sp. HN11]|uniref:alginate export family protein n=1 Tax=Pseudomonas sp. HN11 TaxID=1344094 RepID=UPI001F20808D|nr:alginate export family protein [Pseudomonas sp. HN11]UII68932.1 alginate export family protein [Pseudomonas sp. HN11]
MKLGLTNVIVRCVCIAGSLWCTVGQAYVLVDEPDRTLSLDVSSTMGVFHSQKNYQQWGNRAPGHSSWQEGYIKYGLSGSLTSDDLGSAFGTVNRTASATWGDGDAAGFTNGTERTDKWEEAFAGWRSADLFPALGKDGVEVSAGRQAILLGDGFLVAGDGISAGRGVADNRYNRGGGYYITPRRAFDQTFWLKLGGQQGLHGSLGWFKSDNPIQAKVEMAFSTLEYTADIGTAGLTYLHGLGVDRKFASGIQADRDGMDVYSLRATGNAGVPGLFLSTEIALQNTRRGNAKAGYVEAAWTFADLPGKQTLGYRFSQYGVDWDSLLYGFSRGYGTWFQGEVAANYAGPFGANTTIQQVYWRAQPYETLAVNVLAYDFRNQRTRGAIDSSGRELDFILDWSVTPTITLSPMLSLYDPRKDADHGGVQLGDDKLNVYSAVLISTRF